MYPRTIIDSLPAVPNRDQLTHKDLHAHFSTGQSILLSGSGRDKKYGYRNGIQTDLGDIRNDVWRDLVRELIVRSHEEDLFDKLLEWEKEHTYWLKTKAELEHYTLELYEYSARDCAPQPLKLSIHSGGIEHPCRCR